MTINRLNKYTKEARQVMTYARSEAQRLRHRLVGTEHILLGILKLNDPLIESVFLSLQASTTRISQALDFVVGRGNKAILSEPALSVAARATLARAEEEAAAAQADLVSSEHLLLSIFGERDGIAVGVLESFGVHIEAVRQKLASLANGGYEDLRLSMLYQTRYDATPTLNQSSRDLTMAALAGKLDPMIGRETELERTMQILARRSKNNPVLVGPAGVGKTAIAEGLALRIVQEQVPENLQQCRVVALDVGLLTVGTKFRGDFEERLKRIMREIISTPGMIIVIDELHTLVRTGVAEGSIDAANLFKPMLARGEFQCIGATTLEEYRKTIEADPALERRFQPVLVAETNARETLEILRGLRSRYEDFHHVRISDEALVAAVQMSSRYIQGRFQPDKAIDLVDEAASRMRVRRSVAPGTQLQLRDGIVAVQREKDYAIANRDFPLATTLFKREQQLRRELRRLEYEWDAVQQQQRATLEAQDIARVVAMWTGIPVTQITQEETEQLLHLEEKLHRRIIGQHEAVQVVAKAIRRSRMDMRDSRRPVGSFIFAGPTGVGKSELARALAATLFDDESAMLKLDMSEFMEGHHISRLIGAPPGYVGYDQGGQLTESVRRRPFSVILFDEIEKAHPQILDLLLQILEDGCLTDSHGQTIDFRHTIIIITSNIGTNQLTRGALTFTPGWRSEHERQVHAYEQMREHILRAVRELFRPEFLNRIDEVVIFHPLEQEHLNKIVDVMVTQIQQRLAEQSITLQVSDDARLLLARRGYDPTCGARHLRRTLQRLLEDTLAEAILQGALLPGDSALVDVRDDELSIRVPVTVDVASAPKKCELV